MPQQAPARTLTNNSKALALELRREFLLATPASEPEADAPSTPAPLGTLPAFLGPVWAQPSQAGLQAHMHDHVLNRDGLARAPSSFSVGTE